MFPSGNLYEEISEPNQETATGQISENSNGNKENGAELIDDSVTRTSNLEAEVSDLPLERCMRIVPHDQNSGAFFIAVLHKLSPVPGKNSRFGPAWHLLILTSGINSLLSPLGI